MMFARGLFLARADAPRILLRRPFGAAPFGPLALVAGGLVPIGDKAQIGGSIGRRIGKAAQFADRIG